MHLYKNRNGYHLADGQEKVDRPYDMYARESLPVTVPFLFAVFLITVGGGISVFAFNSGWQFTALGTCVWDW